MSTFWICQQDGCTNLAEYQCQDCEPNWLSCLNHLRQFSTSMTCSSHPFRSILIKLSDQEIDSLEKVKKGLAYLIQERFAKEM